MKELLARHRRAAWGIAAVSCAYAVVLWASRTSRFSLETLSAIHADASTTYPPGQAASDYWGNPWDTTAFNPFNSAIPLAELLVGIGYFGGVVAVGLWVGNRTPRVRNWPLALRTLSSFLIGYTLLLGPERLTLMALPMPSGPRLLVAVTSCVFLFGLVRVTVSELRHRKSKGTRRYRMRHAAQLMMAIAIAGACVVQRVQSGRNFLVTDSGIAFIGAATSIASSGPSEYAPWWDQQSDEWVFNAPMWFGVPGSHLGLWALLTASLAMASAIGIISGFAWSVLPARRRGLKAAVVVGIPLVASTTPVPWLYVSLIGGQNPLWYLGMPGRYAGVALPLLAVIALPRVLETRISIPTAAVLATFSVGIGFMTVSTGFMVLVAVACCVIWTAWSQPTSHGARHQLPNEMIERTGSLVTVLIASLLVVFAYSIATSDVVLGAFDSTPQTQTLAASALLTGILIGLAVFLGNSLRWSRAHPDHTLSFRGIRVALFAFLVPIGAGLVISGNSVYAILADSGLYSTLAKVLPGYGTVPLTRGINSSAIAGTFSFGEFNGVECWITGHCSSLGGLFGGYGMVLLLALVAAGALTSVASSGSKARLLRNALVLSMTGLLFGLLITDFTGATDLASAWLKTRFIEAPLYALIIISCCAVVGSRLTAVRTTGTAVLAACLALAVLGSSIADQWLTNLVWLIHNFQVGIA